MKNEKRFALSVLAGFIMVFGFLMYNLFPRNSDDEIRFMRERALWTDIRGETHVQHTVRYVNAVADTTKEGSPVVALTYYCLTDKLMFQVPVPPFRYAENDPRYVGGEPTRKGP